MGKERPVNLRMSKWYTEGPSPRVPWLIHPERGCKGKPKDFGEFALLELRAPLNPPGPWSFLPEMALALSSCSAFRLTNSTTQSWLALHCAVN